MIKFRIVIFVKITVAKPKWKFVINANQISVDIVLINKYIIAKNAKFTVAKNAYCKTSVVVREQLIINLIYNDE